VTIHKIDLYSGNLNPCQIKPTFNIDGLSLTIMPETIRYNGKIHDMKEPVKIEIPTSDQKSYAKIYFVEDLEQNEIIIVADVFSPPSQTEWVPDPTKHKIIHIFSHFEIPENTEKLDDLNIFVYNINLPKEQKNI